MAAFSIGDQNFQLSSSTFNDVGGATADLFNAFSSSSNAKLKAEGDITEAQNYELASQLAKENAQETEIGTQVTEAQEQRALALSLGSTKAETAGAGFENSGSALYILRSSAQQGALQESLTGYQGAVTEAGYNEQATAYQNLAQYAYKAAGEVQSGGLLGEIGGFVGAGLKGAAAIASMAAV